MQYFFFEVDALSLYASSFTWRGHFTKSITQSATRKGFLPSNSLTKNAWRTKSSRCLLFVLNSKHFLFGVLFGILIIVHLRRLNNSLSVFISHLSNTCICTLVFSLSFSWYSGSTTKSSGISSRHPPSPVTLGDWEPF